MALFVTSSSGPCFDRAWPEERLLTHLLRTAATSAPEAFKSLQGDHPVDIYQSQQAYEIRTDAPGFSQDDIVVEVHEDVLRIAAGTSKPSPAAKTQPTANGQRTANGQPTADGHPTANGHSTTSAASAPRPSSPDSSATAQWKLLRRERSQPSSWSRAFLLPETADVEHVSVRLDKGLLTVHVPRCPPPPKTQPRRIAVNAQ